MKNKKLISVALTAYNIAPYIEEAMDSVIKQKGEGFNVELVIGEDCSTDNTREIIQKYEAKYPEIIKPLYYEKNKGLMGNLLTVLDACKGEYTAIIDGDDYWLYDDKLDRQFQVMEKNADVALCLHNTLRICLNPETNQFEITGKQNENDLKTWHTFEDVIDFAFPGYTSTMFFRSAWLEKPEWLMDGLSNSDSSLMTLLAEKGRVYFSNEPQSAYRTHPTNYSKGTNSKKIRDAMFNYYHLLNKHYDYKYDSLIKPKIYYYKFLDLQHDFSFKGLKELMSLATFKSFNDYKLKALDIAKLFFKKGK